MKRQLIISLLVLLFLLLGTGIAILYGTGYRFGLSNGRLDLSGTGMLVATSTPDGAQVFINDHLITATDNTRNLFPGTYRVKIVKEGYFPWEKTVTIEKEVVTKAEALLFPKAPKLESITFSGVGNPTLDPSQTRLAYTIASQSARKNGIYILDMSQRPVLTLQSASKQIADDTIDAFSTSFLSWSPDGNELLASVSNSQSLTTYLLNTDRFNETPDDVTATLPIVDAGWERDRKDEERARLATVKPQLRSVIQESFDIIAWAPDETKILYTASNSADIPVIIKPRLIGNNPTPEERELKKDNVYVYDSKEDKNYRINTGTVTDGDEIRKSLKWFPDSKHIIFVDNKKVNIMEYDGLNTTTVYAGPFVDRFVFPWPNGEKIVILTNLGNPDISPNLYTISLGE